MSDKANKEGEDWGCVVLIALALLCFTAYQIALLFVLKGTP